MKVSRTISESELDLIYRGFIAFQNTHGLSEVYNGDSSVPKTSGLISHGKDPFSVINFFGPTRQACELLDGVFLAIRLKTLAHSGLRFDKRFDYHVYDMDFCRSARSLGLQPGTWPIALTHQSAGSHGDEWQSSHAKYLAKWGD